MSPNPDSCVFLKAIPLSFIPDEIPGAAEARLLADRCPVGFVFVAWAGASQLEFWGPVGCVKLNVGISRRTACVVALALAVATGLSTVQWCPFFSTARLIGF